MPSILDPNALRAHLDLILLGTLERGPLYGLRIIGQVEEETNGAFRFREGTLYPALHRLEKRRLIRGSVVPSDAGGPPRKEYALTTEGSRELARLREGYRALTEALRPYGEPA